MRRKDCHHPLYYSLLRSLTRRWFELYRKTFLVGFQPFKTWSLGQDLSELYVGPQIRRREKVSGTYLTTSMLSRVDFCRLWDIETSE